MSETFRVACVQNTAGRDMAPSIADVVALIRAARGDGADLITLPEMVNSVQVDAVDFTLRIRLLECAYLLPLALTLALLQRQRPSQYRYPEEMVRIG